LSDQEDNCFLIKPNPITVADVTGAGDAFWSGVITGILNGNKMLEAVCAGQVIAEIKLKSIGPIKEMPEWHQIIEDSKSIHTEKC
jgi:fructokinase